MSTKWSWFVSAALREAHEPSTCSNIASLSLSLSLSLSFVFTLLCFRRWSRQRQFPDVLRSSHFPSYTRLIHKSRAGSYLSLSFFFLFPPTYSTLAPSVQIPPKISCCVPAGSSVTDYSPTGVSSSPSSTPFVHFVSIVLSSNGSLLTMFDTHSSSLARFPLPPTTWSSLTFGANVSWNGSRNFVFGVFRVFGRCFIGGQFPRFDARTTKG